MIVIIPTSCILILSDQNTKELDEVELVKGFFNKFVSHYVIYFVVNFSFTPFANNWKLMFAMNSIAFQLNPADFVDFYNEICTRQKPCVFQ